MTIDINLTPSTTSSTSSDDDDLGHTYCCLDENVGLCGADLTDAPEMDGCTDCVVCIDLDRVGDYCPRRDFAPCPPLED